MRTSPVAIYAYQKGYTVHQAADLAYWVASLKPWPSTGFLSGN